MPPSGGRRWPAGAVGGGAATAYELCGRSRSELSGTELARVDCRFDPVRVSAEPESACADAMTVMPR